MSNPQVLIHCLGTGLEDEVRAAVKSLSDMRPVLHVREDLRGTIADARDYQPGVILLEIGNDFELLKTLVDESIAAAPDAIIVGVYSADRLPDSHDESATMMRALRLGVEDFIRRPVAVTELQQILQRHLAPRRRHRAQTGRTIAFCSNKGGVGKSTAAVNVATELASRHPGRVALIDASLQMGVCAAQLNLRPEITLTDAWQQRERLDERLLEELMTHHESGLHVLAAPTNAIEATEFDDAFLSRVLLLARRAYDYVIVDTFPLLDRSVMAILDLSDRAIVVVENVVPTLQTVRGYFDLLAEVEFPEAQQKVLLNRYTTRSGGPGVSEVARYLDREIDYVLPFDRSILLAANTGKPFVSSASRWNRSAKAIRNMADEIETLARSPEEASAGEQGTNHSQLRSSPRLSVAGNLEGGSA